MHYSAEDICRVALLMEQLFSLLPEDLISACSHSGKGYIQSSLSHHDTGKCTHQPDGGA